MSSNLELKFISELLGKEFYIPSYQRGYKWDVHQVLDLLEDINDFEEVGDSFYCLQPLAVLTKEINKTYEVIDGQQRLTTIHIILSIIDNGIYALDYQTRTHSKLLLENIKANFDAFEVAFNVDIDKLKEAINDKWSDYIKIKKTEIINNENKKIKDFNNIDFYHIFMAFLTIKAWFLAKNRDKVVFKTKLLDQTKFIWYNETYEQDPKKVFRNLNSGKVPLTNAELIKALFINSLKDPNKEIQQLKQTTLATEWDDIETTLQDDQFWYFINNTRAGDYQTRIDYLFELEKGKTKKDKLHTYHEYAKIAKTNNGRLSEKEWKAIKNLFLKLREWYEQRNWYHLIGFITASWDKVKALKTIKEVIELNEGKTKKIFWKELMKIIETILNEDGEMLVFEDLNYNDSPKLLNRILLLHNIITYDKDISGFRFPFQKFKIAKDGEERVKWSLEHIHAQQSNDVKTIGELKSWMSADDMTQMIEAAKNKLDIDATSIERNSEKLKTSYANQNLMEKVSEEQRQYLREIEEQLKMHQLWNMALLDRNTNAGLGKKPFKGKREAILEKVRNGSAFIPICTKNAFLKVYTKDIEQLDYWSYTDRTAYIKNIEITLTKYLKKTPENND